MRIAWHYTTGHRAIDIVKDGFINPATCNVAPHEIPVVWFSLHQVWEPTARKGLIDKTTGKKVIATVRQMDTYCGGLYRFGVEINRLVRWCDLSRLAGIRTATAEKLARAGRKLGATPSDWFGTVEKIALDGDVRIERRTDGAWKTCNPEEVEDSGASR